MKKLARHRMAAMAMVTLASPSAWSAPDNIDKQVAKDLQALIVASGRQHPEWPLHEALKRVRLARPSTSFGNEPSEDGRVFPSARPRGVSKPEWQALKASGIYADGENGMGSYTLIDLDGDGHRDQIVNTYIGGTGLYNGIDVYRWSKGRFVSRHPLARRQDDAVPLYTTNGRGGNQDAVWIWARGRPYAAYIDFADRQKVMSLTVRYRYRLQLLKPNPAQSPSGVPLAPPLSAAQQLSVQRALDALARDTKALGPMLEHPICPPVATAGTDEVEASQYFGPGHYTFEIVADMPVHMPEGCRSGRLVDWFGRYRAGQGLYAQLWLMTSPQDQTYDSYEVMGRRQFVSVSSPRRASLDEL
jgi:hypothetical protein